MINFDKLPSDKPSNNATIEKGHYRAKITKAEIKTGKEDNTFLLVTFKTKDEQYVSEVFTDTNKPFPMFKIGRLLKATGVVLEGTGSLADVAKLILNKVVEIDVDVNDKGYAGLDFSDKKEGMYPVESTSKVAEPEPELDEDVAEALAEDDDF